MPRLKDIEWDLPKEKTWQHVEVAVAMDLRDQLIALNQAFSGLPPCTVRLLQKIERQLRVQRRCVKHPRYTATRRPRIACAGCHRDYKAVWK